MVCVYIHIHTHVHTHSHTYTHVETDGYIFVKNDEPYRHGRCDTLLKWKPADKNSVDFKFKVTSQLDGTTVAQLLVSQAGGLVLFLESGCSEIRVSDPKSAERLRGLDGHIVECRWDGKRWVFMKERRDKTHPNALSTASNVFKR
jgi:hypothetical protein